MVTESFILLYYVGLPNVVVCGEKQLSITNAATTFKWGGYGLNLCIQENSLPVGTNQITLNIATSIAGRYEFPENCHLVSAVYWFRCEPLCNFEKQVTVEIEHCAKSENVSKLSFVRAVSNQEKLPYTFQHLEGGQFMNHSSYGVLELSRLSGISVVQKYSEEKYYASLFYLSQESINRQIHFIVTLNTKVHLTVSLDVLVSCSWGYL